MRQTCTSLPEAGSAQREELNPLIFITIGRIRNMLPLRIQT